MGGNGANVVTVAVVAQSQKAIAEHKVITDIFLGQGKGRLSLKPAIGASAGTTG